MTDSITPARRKLLVALESIIGTEIYDPSIRNYGPGGARGLDGRAYRYPLRVKGAEGEIEQVKDYSIPSDIGDDALRSGHYAFGGNQLHVIKALGSGPGSPGAALRLHHRAGCRCAGDRRRRREGNLMNWGDWIGSEGSIDTWKSAAMGLSEVFTTTNRHVERPRAYPKGGALWVEVRNPRDGVRLVAISLPRLGNTQGHITLRIWTSDTPENAYLRFSSGPAYSLQGRAWVRNLNLRPGDSWEAQLRKEDKTVRGLWYSGKLSDFGSPEDAEAWLATVFRTFCEFVAERYAAASTPSTASDAKQEQVPTSTPALDVHEEREISALVEGLVGIADSERDAIVKARIGQSKFRDRLLSRWGGACSVTGLKTSELLIASHIVPWSACTTANERWDVNNGLLLTPGLDKAFELGYITFQHEGEDKGHIVISPKAHVEIRRRLGFDDQQLQLTNWHDGLALYLERHRLRWHLSDH